MNFYMILFWNYVEDKTQFSLIIIIKSLLSTYTEYSTYMTRLGREGGCGVAGAFCYLNKSSSSYDISIVQRLLTISCAYIVNHVLNLVRLKTLSELVKCHLPLAAPDFQ